MAPRYRRGHTATLRLVAASTSASSWSPTLTQWSRLVASGNRYPSHPSGPDVRQLVAAAICRKEERQTAFTTSDAMPPAGNSQPIAAMLEIISGRCAPCVISPFLRCWIGWSDLVSACCADQRCAPAWRSVQPVTHRPPTGAAVAVVVRHATSWPLVVMVFFPWASVNAAAAIALLCAWHCPPTVNAFGAVNFAHCPVAFLIAARALRCV